jgi:hypothetical protein
MESKSEEYFNVLDLIHELYDKLSLFIIQGQPKVKKPEIYTNLKTHIENERAYWEDPKYKRKNNENNEERESKKV